MTKNIKHIGRSFLGILGILFVSGLVGEYLVCEAMAQTRPALVKDVENPARSAYSDAGTVEIPLHFINNSSWLSPIPEGKRLVIEHVSVQCTADADDEFPLITIGVYKKLPDGWQSITFPLQTIRQGNTHNGKGSWVVSQSVRLYADHIGPEGPIIDIHHAKTASANAYCHASISGYTVDVP